MPRTGGGFISWVIGTVLISAVGIAILSRIPPVWSMIVKQ